MTDGSKSPKFGKFHPLDNEAHLAASDNVKYIRTRGNRENVQALAFLDHKQKPFFEIEGSFTDGETVTQVLEDSEQVVGVYGIYNYQPYVVGLGFILWSPNWF